MRGFPSISPFLKQSRRIGPPNVADISRRFKKRIGNSLIDSVAGRNAELLLPVTAVTASTIITFTDLSGVTIVSYDGDQVLNISGNTIISSGVGEVSNLILSDGTHIPIIHLLYDVVGSNNIIDLVGASEEYASNGSAWMLNKGYATKINPELITNSGFEGTYINGIAPEWMMSGTLTTTEEIGLNGKAQGVTDGDNGNVLEYRHIFTEGMEYELMSRGKRLSGSGMGYVRLLSSVIGSSANVLTIESDEWIEVTYTFTAIATISSVVRIHAPTGTLIAFDEVSLKESRKIIPNNEEGLPIINDYDSLTSGTPFLNNSPWRVRLFTAGDTDQEFTFFDKSNTAIYEAAVQASDNYIVGDTGNFHKDEINQLWIWENIKLAFKYKWWVRIIANQYRDLFFYNTALSTQKDIDSATNYTKTPEP